MLRRSLIPILILALAGSQGPATAGTSDGRARLTELRLPTGTVTATSSGGALEVSGLRLEDLITEHIDPTDVRSHPDAVRAFIEQTRGVTLPDLRPEHSAEARRPSEPELSDRAFDEPPPIPDEEPEENGTLSYPSPGGDLNGDGLADLLVYDVTLPEEKIHLRALAGTDGGQIWQRPIEASDAVGLPVGDLSGDGIDDLLLWSFDVTEETEVDDCADEASCRYQYDATYDWIVGLRSGADGKRIWATRYAGEDHYLYVHEEEGTPPVTSTQTDEESFESTNYTVFPFVSGDHDGDGLADLVLESIDLDSQYQNVDESTAGAVHQNTGQFHLHGAARAQVTRGADGTPLFSRSAEMGPGVAVLQPLDDLVGNSAPDLLWEESVVTDNAYSCVAVATLENCPDEPDEGYSIELDLIDGSTMQPAWHTAIDGVSDGFSIALPEDVTGDGVDDVLVTALVEQEMPFVLQLRSGADGSLVWTREQRVGSHYWEFPVSFQDMTGDGTTDLVLGSFMTLGGPSGDGYAAGFSRVNGRTGATLSETTRPFPGVGDHVFTATYLYMGGVEDVEGDGIDDLLAGSVSAGYDPGSESGGSVLNEVISAAVLESGPSGTTIHEKTAPEPLTVEAPADLSGDGVTDAIEWHYPKAEGGDYGVLVHRLTPTTTLWSRTLNEDEFWNMWVGGDHDGAPGEELLYARNDLVERTWRSKIASLLGISGTERWVLEA